MHARTFLGLDADCQPALFVTDTLVQDLRDQSTQPVRDEKCETCHPAPDYTTGKLTLAEGYEPPRNHPFWNDIRRVSIGTDAGLAFKTRKGTGFYKIPSLRGLWYRPRLLHDASIVSLEELFDEARLRDDYERKGWSPPGVTSGAIPGLEFLTRLPAETRQR